MLKDAISNPPDDGDGERKVAWHWGAGGWEYGPVIAFYAKGLWYMDLANNIMPIAVTHYMDIDASDRGLREELATAARVPVEAITIEHIERLAVLLLGMLLSPALDTFILNVENLVIEMADSDYREKREALENEQRD
jgi:hypothetical protein